MCINQENWNSQLHLSSSLFTISSSANYRSQWTKVLLKTSSLFGMLPKQFVTDTTWLYNGSSFHFGGNRCALISTYHRHELTNCTLMMLYKWKNYVVFDISSETSFTETILVLTSGSVRPIFRIDSLSLILQPSMNSAVKTLWKNKLHSSNDKDEINKNQGNI